MCNRFNGQKIVIKCSSDNILQMSTMWNPNWSNIGIIEAISLDFAQFGVNSDLLKLLG